MGLRCSLLGHDFGEAELDRDREERGDEVVITIREVKTCRRCGDERVLSENTEVRPVEPISEVENTEPNDTGAEEPAGAAAGGDVTGASEAGADTGSVGADASEGSAEIIDADAGAAEASDDGTANAGTDSRGEDGAAGGDSALGANVASDDGTIETDAASDGVAGANAADDDDGVTGANAADDDGVIIDDESEEVAAERGAGEWPDAEDTRMDERDVPAEAGPEVEVEPDEGDGEDAEILDGESEPADADEDEPAAEDDTPQASEWPDPKGEDEGFDAEPGSGGGTDMEFSGIAPEGDSGAAATPSESPSMEVDSETAFVCPECGFAKPAAKASLRAGDICPECKKGYLREE